MDLIQAAVASRTRSLALLGASGSVGSTTLRYLRQLDRVSGPGADREKARIELNAVSVHRSVMLLRELLVEFSDIKHAALSDADVYRSEVDGLKADFPSVRFYGGAEGVVELVRETQADTVLTAVVGAAGIDATVAAVQGGKKIALANKETLVTAGPAIQYEAERAAKKGLAVSFLPVDSEHNAAFQLLEGLHRSRLSRLILTASGGPFRDRTADEIRTVSRDEVLNHPTWKMGPKISVDSAGMINKGLEIIEAHFLFDLAYDQLDVRIHRNSYVHAMVKTSDGGMILAASPPDMIFPVAHALHYPEAVPMQHVADDECARWPALQFEAVDPAKYPGFSLCMQAGRRGGTAPAILNAANEVAVAIFLDGGIPFYRIPELVDDALQNLPAEDGRELGLFQEADRRTREYLMLKHAERSAR